ncbi:hypothetical protein [Longispora fulva]|uniref:Uncharacterized protein n=1 Tax=Longispora fulva TaxID=619741 RepID=A0A8J7GT72_9ACTN|nr:hypothetical protein [Longispora fulva]MBG6137938.1 hypothetical protein [Longispora fulva]
MIDTVPTPERPIVPSPTPTPTNPSPPTNKTTPTAEATVGPNRATTAPTSTAPKLRTATASGGQAMFYYTAGQVDLLDLSPCYGYSYEAYRLENDYIVVRFVGYGHVSTIYAYWSKSRQPTLSVYEEDY